MSEQAEVKQVNTDVGEEESAQKTVKRGGIGIGVVIVISLLWYLLADRYTPYTSQARIQGYVVGVAPNVSGVVTQVWVKNNQKVKAGEALFEVDPSQYRIAFEGAQSEMENARRQVEAGSAAVDSARAGLSAALANEIKSEKDAERLKRLYEAEPGAISMRRLEVSQASLDQARAKVVAAEADIQRAIEQKGGSDIENNSILKSAMSTIEKAKLDLDHTIVRATSDGVITDLKTEVGQFAGTGNPVMTLVAIGDVWISAEFTENNLGHMRVGDAVEMVLDALPGSIFKGKVRSIGLGVSTGQAQPTGTLPSIDNNRDWLRQAQRFPVSIGFDHQQDPELSQNLRIGGQASVISYSKGHGFLAILGKLYIRIISVFSYVY